LELPAIVACGYRRIDIPKSGNTFPAFLIAFEEEPPGSIDNTNGLSPSRRARFAWRSKKDFLLLSRKGGGINFPKAALKKVVDEGAVPWRRSSDDTTGMNGNKSQSAIPDCLTDPSLPNQYSARMKKSIWQLDHFLQSIQSKAGNSEQIQNAWDSFCRESDTENLVAPRQFSASGISQFTKNSANTNEISVDNQGCTEHSSTSNTKIDEPITTLKESSRLGQYFASKENSRKVVEFALDKILPLYELRNNAQDKITANSNAKIIFVEPSCGHGDIVVSLVEALKERHIPPTSVGILGYDIDPGAIEVCRKRQEFVAKNTESNSSDNMEHDNCKSSNYTVFWDCKSFFETNREQGIHRFDIFFKMDSDSTKANPPDILICFLGGPPYTTGQGSGSAMKRDLPERFVDHCVHEWKADVISFLLPARYREDPRKILCDGSLVATPNEHSDTNRWMRETQELEASKFLFRGTIEVTQPSIIKVLSLAEFQVN